MVHSNAFHTRGHVPVSECMEGEVETYKIRRMREWKKGEGAGGGRGAEGKEGRAAQGGERESGRGREATISNISMHMRYRQTHTTCAFYPVPTVACDAFLTRTSTSRLAH